MLVPYGYGYCRIDVPGSPPDTSDWYQACKFNVANKSKIDYKEVKIEAESINYYIHKKIIGYRPEFDLYLYADDLHEDSGYGLNLTKNEFFNNNDYIEGQVEGEYHNLLFRGEDVDVTGGGSYSKIADDRLDKWYLYDNDYDSHDPEDVWSEWKDNDLWIHHTVSNGDWFLLYNTIDYSVHDGDKFKTTLKFKNPGGIGFSIKISVWYNWSNVYDRQAITIANESFSGYDDGEWHWLTVEGEFSSEDLLEAVNSTPGVNEWEIKPEYIQYVESGLVLERSASSYPFKVSYLKTTKTGKQGDLLQFMRRLRQNPREDGSIQIYPITDDTDSGFWDVFKSYDEVRYDRFIIDNMEILDAVESEKKLGNVLHIQGREADIISKDEFDSLIYRDTRTGQFNRIPHYTKQPTDSPTTTQLLLDKDIINTT